MSQIATLPEVRQNSNINGKAHRKENAVQGFEQYSAIATEGQTGHYAYAPVICRLYYTNTRAYCCLWVNHAKSGTHVSGSAYAGGYGYHRASAAVQNAINKAGIKLSESISGVGTDAIEQAILAICEALGEKVVLHKANQ